MSVDDRRTVRALPQYRYDLLIGVTTNGYYAKISNGLNFAIREGGSPEQAVKRALSCCHRMFRSDLSQNPGDRDRVG